MECASPCDECHGDKVHAVLNGGDLYTSVS
jgi:hypothetical protein